MVVVVVVSSQGMISPSNCRMPFSAPGSFATLQMDFSTNSLRSGKGQVPVKSGPRKYKENVDYLFRPFSEAGTTEDIFERHTVRV